jgi:ATP-dependent RNA helicase RhlE
MSFAIFGLCPELLEALTVHHYKSPTPIQAQVIPHVLKGRDVIAAAQTGTGKTASFALPILQRLHRSKPVGANRIKVLVLTPTRELAAQVKESIAGYGANLPLRSAVVYGGVKINPPMMKLRRGIDILVATPGRLMDLYHQNAVKFDQLEVLVLDEADRMLDMGFIQDIRKILTLLPTPRQNLMFSATFSKEIRTLSQGLLSNPIEISVNPPNSTATTVKQWICPVDKKQKPYLLSKLIKTRQWTQLLVFTKTKVGANKLTRHLQTKGIKAAALHGDKSQAVRTKALSDFKTGAVTILVATDVAARGLDIEQLPQVVNFDLPTVAEDYIHRIGRTGRAGSKGEAVSLVSADEFKQLTEIERLLKRLLPRKLVDGFEPDHNIPESTLDLRPRKPKKPRKLKNPLTGAIPTTPRKKTRNSRGNTPKRK